MDINIKKYLAYAAISGLSSGIALAGKTNKNNSDKNIVAQRRNLVVAQQRNLEMPRLLNKLHGARSFVYDPVSMGFNLGENPRGRESTRYRNKMLKKTMSSVSITLSELFDEDTVSNIINSMKYIALRIVADELPSFVRQIINEFRDNGCVIQGMEESDSLRLFIANSDPFTYVPDSNRLNGREQMAIRYFVNNAVSGNNGFLHQVGLRAIDEILLVCHGFDIKISRQVMCEIENQIRTILNQVGSNVVNLVGTCLGSYAGDYHRASEARCSEVSCFGFCNHVDKMPLPMSFARMCSNLEYELLNGIGFDLCFVNTILQKRWEEVGCGIDFSNGIPQNLQNMIIIMIYMNLAKFFPNFAKEMIIGALENDNIDNIAELQDNIRLCLSNDEVYHQGLLNGCVTQEQITMLRNSSEAIKGNGGLFNIILVRILTNIKLLCNVLKIHMTQNAYVIIENFTANMIRSLEVPTIRSLMFELQQRNLFDPATGRFFRNTGDKKCRQRKESLKSMNDNLETLTTRLIDGYFGKGVSNSVVNFVSSVAEIINN
ncbi:MAG: hypothetical protein LBB20_02955 [Puniceicoccales bacterium]|jgi:hypothetical protein|nr:hypothetical protein [Puniceicoccales bacterium]